MNRFFQSFLLLLCVFSLMIPAIPVNAVQSGTESDAGSLNDTVSSAESPDYSDYLLMHPADERGTGNYICKGADYAATFPATAFTSIGSYEGCESVLLCEPGASQVDYRFQVTVGGWYTIKMGYYPLDTKRFKEEISLHINDTLPFSQATALTLDYTFVPESEQIYQNASGDEYASRRIVNSAWTKSALKNPDHNYDDALQFYFTPGENIISICFSDDCNFVLSAVEITPIAELPSYKDYLNGQTKASGEQTIKVEAESVVLQSDSVVIPSCEQGDPLCSPKSVSNLKINVINASWRSHGQWLEWEIPVEKSGWYQLSIRYKQNDLKGLSVKRCLSIDGQIPFEEASRLAFPYASSWRLRTVADENDTPFLFYLEKGTHRLRLENVLGELAETIREIDSIVYDMNSLYRSVVMTVSTTTDKYRDYQIMEDIPEVIPQLNQCAERLEECVKQVNLLSGGSSADSAILVTTASQLRSMAEDPNTIPERLTSWESNIGSVSSWGLTIREQPLQMDYMVFSQDDSVLPSSKANFFQKAVHSAKRFFFSFIKDYNSLDADSGDKVNLNVWVSTGRDQSETIWKMAEDLFTSKTEIGVKVKLVSATMIEAFLSGQAPDLTVQAARDLPVNLALRGALLDLSAFDEFEEVNGWFAEGALVPYTFQNCVYGLPDSQSFNMMFYRTDVFDELGLSVPQTWQEFINVANQLHLYQLETGIPIDTDTSMFYTLLFQKGGEVFTKDLSKTLLTQRTAIDAFAEWTDMFTVTGLPLSYDFFNRFRSGEMPLAIAPYINYNQLSAAAPEIRNLWKMTLIPGTVDENGEIHREESANGTATVILASTEHPKEAWQFVRWWIGDAAQTHYAQEIEARVGTIGRVACANTKALQGSNYPSDVRKVLLEQRDYVKEIPQVPGNYYLERDLLNAFRDVIYNSRNTKESILDYSKRINGEIERKRKELGIE